MRTHRKDQFCEKWTARQHPHPLQRRLARLHRLGHGYCTHLQGFPEEYSFACLGGRDPTAQPGRPAHRLGIGTGGGSAYCHSGQCRWTSDAARHGGSLSGRQRPDNLTVDVANKIGTYLKALAAFDNQVPFYVALPSSSIDFTMKDGVLEIPIEQRGGEEVTWMEGLMENGIPGKVNIINPSSPVANYGFDVTPSRYVTGLITERGICPATEAGIFTLFPEKSPPAPPDLPSSFAPPDLQSGG
ncbi:MAG: hypothetical protein WCI31_09735 [Prolixibacteraceae bacterium]